MLDEHTETGVARHDGAAGVTSVGDAGTAGLALGVFDVEHALRVALDVALFGSLADAEHGLPPPRSDFKERASVGAVSFGFTHILSVSSTHDAERDCLSAL